MTNIRISCDVCGDEGASSSRVELEGQEVLASRCEGVGCRAVRAELLGPLGVLRQLSVRSPWGLSTLTREAKRALDGGPTSPNIQALRGCAVFLALSGQREAVLLDGCRGGEAIVVTTLRPELVVSVRRRSFGSNGGLRAQPVERERLREVLRANGPLDLKRWLGVDA